MLRLPDTVADRLAGMAAALRQRCGAAAGGDDPRIIPCVLRLNELDLAALRNTAVADTRFVVIDTETTGFRAYAGDEIVSIAMLEMRGTALTGRSYETLVNPRRPIPKLSSEIHGIYDADVLDAPTLPEVLPEVLEFIDHGVLVGHHVNFDLRFLNRIALRRLHRRLPQPWVDTMLLFLAVSGRLGHYTLEQVAAACQVRIDKRHSATGDAHAAADIFSRLARELADAKTTLGQLLDRQFAIHGH
jgi:DNA polymerase-3 subunit epsilon